MKSAAYVLGILLLTGCAMTPAQKKWAGITASVLIVGAIAAHDADTGRASSSSATAALGTPSPPCVMQSEGTCR